jgi:hypothetical protein
MRSPTSVTRLCYLLHHCCRLTILISYLFLGRFRELFSTALTLTFMPHCHLLTAEFTDTWTLDDAGRYLVFTIKAHNHERQSQENVDE